MEKEGEKLQCARETSMRKRYSDQLPLAQLQVGTWPATQACALTGNQIGDFSVCRLAPMEPHLTGL